MKSEAMKNIRLTDEADLMLCTLYKAFKDNRANGEDRYEARIFGGSETLQILYFQSWPIGDIDDIAWELSKNKLLTVNNGDNSVQDCALTTDAISYMEHRFGDKLEALLQRITALRAFLLPL